jgi:integrase
VANTATTLVWNCKTEKGWRRYPVVMATNGRVKTGVVLIDGREVRYPDGRFQIRYFIGDKTVYENAGEDPVEALALRDRLSRRKEVIAQAKVAGVEVKKETGRIIIGPAVAKYIQHLLDVDASEASKVYLVALDDLVRTLPNLRYVDEITSEAMVSFGAALRKEGSAPQTIYNKHKRIKSFLNWCNVDVRSLKLRTPRFEKKKVLVYSEAVVEALLKANTDPYFRVVLDVLRMTGLREQEAAHLQWPDIDFKRKLVLVRSKPEFGWNIKDREERDVPLPSALATVLKAWYLKRGRYRWVLGTAKDRPNANWLLELKAVARSAGLNCGRCKTCRVNSACALFTLHAWRRTYATALSRKGIDLKTIMGLLGHSDLATVSKYIAGLEAEEANARVDAAFN